jgi:hypothetical protein
LTRQARGAYGVCTRAFAMLHIPQATRRLLESAGYAWDQAREAWGHPRTGHTLSGKVSRLFTPEQVAMRIKAGGQ